MCCFQETHLKYTNTDRFESKRLAKDIAHKH